MQIQAYLIISRGGSLRVVKNRPYLNNDEIAVNLDVEVPKVFFERLIPTVKIELPAEAIIDLDATTVIKQKAPEVAQSLKLEVKTVEDGLKTMLENAPRGEEGGVTP